MKKIKAVILVLVLVFVTGTFAFPSLIDVYKRGKIKLVGDPAYGKTNDWESLFYDVVKQITVAPDGSVFVSNGRQNNVYKFSPTGQLIKTFGQKGLGTGDTNLPGYLSILDNKYLVIAENALLLRVSIFDLSGKYYKLLRTKKAPWNVIALKNNTIAFLYINYPPGVNFPQTHPIDVVIKNILTGEEKIVFSTKILDKSVVNVDGTGLTIGKFTGEVFIAQTGDGNLMVGITDKPDILVFSPTGEKINSFKLNMNPLPADNTYIEQISRYKLAKMKINDAKFPFFIKLYKSIENSGKYKEYFNDYLPYYREVFVDSEGNFLFFKWDKCIEKCDPVFQVYSPQGKYICETKLETGIYDIQIDHKWTQMAFTSKGLFGLFQIKNSDDISLRVVKVKLE